MCVCVCVCVCVCLRVCSPRGRSLPFCLPRSPASSPPCLGIPLSHPRESPLLPSSTSLPHTHCPALLPGPGWVLSGMRPPLLPSLPAAVLALSSEVHPVGVSLLSDQHSAHSLSLLVGALTSEAPRASAPAGLDSPPDRVQIAEPAWLSGVQASPCPQPPPLQTHTHCTLSGWEQAQARPVDRLLCTVLIINLPSASDMWAFSFCASACGHRRELRAARRAGGD